MMKLRTGLALGALGLSLGAVVGCTVTNLNHCGLNAGACGEGMACSMCAIENDGCVPQGTPLEEACAFVSGSDPSTTGPQTTTTEPTTLTPTDTSDDGTGTTFDVTTNPGTATDTTTATETTTPGETSSTTEPVPPCEGEVVGNKDCGGDLPYCVENECVSCEDLDCSEVEPEKPTCAVNLGLCVECQQHSDCESLDEPACNTLTATCEPCDSHDQCPATACNLETGQCFPTENVLYVDNTPEDPGGCSDAKPNWGTAPAEAVCTLQNAMSRLDVGVPTTIKIKNGAKPQNLPSTVPEGNFIVAIVHYGNTIPSLVLAFTDPAVTVSAGNKVFMNRISIYNSPMPASDPLIECAGQAVGASLWLERQRIFSGKTAIRANNCAVHIRRSTITANSGGGVGGGVDVDGANAALAKLWIENSYLTENNGGKFGAVRLGGVVDGSILYSTIALNKSGLAPVECINGWGGKLTVRNSALMSDGTTIGPGCIDAELITNAVDLEALSKADITEFFSGFAEGVFQAKIGGALKEQAMWKLGDPRVDYDGTPRPTEPGTADYAGADRPEL